MIVMMNPKTHLRIDSNKIRAPQSEPQTTREPSLRQLKPVTEYKFFTSFTTPSSQVCRAVLQRNSLNLKIIIENLKICNLCNRYYAFI